MSSIKCVPKPKKMIFSGIRFKKKLHCGVNGLCSSNFRNHTKKGKGSVRKHERKKCFCKGNERNLILFAGNFELADAVVKARRLDKIDDFELFSQHFEHFWMAMADTARPDACVEINVFFPRFVPYARTFCPCNDAIQFRVKRRRSNKIFMAFGVVFLRKIIRRFKNRGFHGFPSKFLENILHEYYI